MRNQPNLFDQPEAHRVPKLKWAVFPTGRWATTMAAHGGTLALHAWPEGTWAVTRGQANIKAGEPFVIGSREDGQPIGANLEEAMALAEDAARVVVEREHPDPQ